MNHKGFAISGILYSLLVLFLILLLLILGNFQYRKMIFDKQKNNVLEKLEGIDLKKTIHKFCYIADQELQIFETPDDGLYRLEIYASNSGNYISGNIRLYQGILLYIVVSNGNLVSNIRTEQNKVSSVILSASSDGTYAYTSDQNKNSDIALDYIMDVESRVSIQEECPSSGLVKISRISD